jgi:prevent-host-death family protein
MIMETITVSQLRANLMKVLGQIEKGATILVTSRGRPLAQLSPPRDMSKDSLRALKKLAQTAVIGDIVSPLNEPWESGS